MIFRSGVSTISVPRITSGAGLARSFALSLPSDIASSFRAVALQRAGTATPPDQVRGRLS